MKNDNEHTLVVPFVLFKNDKKPEYSFNASTAVIVCRDCGIDGGFSVWLEWENKMPNAVLARVSKHVWDDGLVCGPGGDHNSFTALVLINSIQIELASVALCTWMREVNSNNRLVLAIDFDQGLLNGMY